MRFFKKQPDTEAMGIRFGVELESKIPRTSGVAVGGYHNGYPFLSARYKRPVCFWLSPSRFRGFWHPLPTFDFPAID